LRLLACLGVAFLTGALRAAEPPPHFPLAVWLQHPTNAPRFRAAGINTFAGLWEGPTAAQLDVLQQSGMAVICAQNELALRRGDTNIIAWMHNDEPDNAQSRGARLGFGSPVPPEKIIADYRRMKTADPSRPVLLNLGQGVAWDGWYGRGRRTNHPEDYPEYLKGCDIASFDIYPVNHTSQEVAGNLWFVARGVERLRNWTEDRKPVWACIECTGIRETGRKPTTEEVRAEVWMALIHGARGVVYFVHQFKPRFVEAALLEDSEMLAVVTALNRQITELAPVLNSPTVTNAVSVTTSDTAVPIATMIKRFHGQTHLFAVAMRGQATTAKFSLPGPAENFSLEVLGEKRSLSATNGMFSDHFAPWAVHLYRVGSAPKP
jgi:hypothetical protein